MSHFYPYTRIHTQICYVDQREFGIFTQRSSKFPPFCNGQCLWSDVGSLCDESFPSVWPDQPLCGLPWPQHLVSCRLWLSRMAPFCRGVWPLQRWAGAHLFMVSYPTVVNTSKQWCGVGVGCGVGWSVKCEWGGVWKCGVGVCTMWSRIMYTGKLSMEKRIFSQWKLSLQNPDFPSVHEVFHYDIMATVI